MKLKCKSSYVSVNLKNYLILTFKIKRQNCFKTNICRKLNKVSVKSDVKVIEKFS